jgi:hypothetical protein
MNIVTADFPDKHQIFAAQCDAVALLWSLGEYGDDDAALHTAVDHLEQIRKRLRLDADLAQRGMARAFAAMRDDLGGWVVP